MDQCGLPSNLQYAVLICVLIITNALLLGLDCLVGNIVLGETIFNGGRHFTENLQEYPFFCEDLSLSPDDDYVTFDANKRDFQTSIYNNQYICKYRNLTAAISKFVERKARIRFAKGENGHRYLQCGKEALKKPSGHLCASFTKVSRHQQYEGTGADLRLHWDTHPGSSFMSEVLTYHNGQIKVPERRFYFVYASVLLNTNMTTTERIKPRRFLLSVCINTHGFERTLLAKSYIFNDNDKNSVSSISVGGHVYLERDDHVYVKVSDPSRIIRDSLGNTFGLMPLK